MHHFMRALSLVFMHFPMHPKWYFGRQAFGALPPFSGMKKTG